MDPTDRFSARVTAYAQARPSYPREALDLLRTHFELDATTAVADLGSGTGIFTKLLLETGALVYAVEPNAEMRAEADRTLGADARYRSVAGRAEATALPDASVDLVTAAQAFHWFDLEPTRTEILRILRPRGRAAFVWNDRDTEGSAFARDFEAVLVSHCPGYRDLQGKSDTPAKFDHMFGPGRWSRHTAHNEQHLDREGLLRRVMSASYAAQPGTAGHDALVLALSAVFDRHAESDRVCIGYTTVIIGGEPTRLVAQN